MKAGAAEDDPHAVLLDERPALAPFFAIGERRNATVKMADLACTLLDAVSLLSHFDVKTADRIERNEQIVDNYVEDKLGSSLVKISSKNLSSADSNDVSQLLHTTGDFERISDHAVNPALRVARELHDKNLKFSENVQQELEIYFSAVVEILNITTDAFDENNLQLAYEVEPLEQVIDKLKLELKTGTSAGCRMAAARSSSASCSDILNNYERVSDHCLEYCGLHDPDQAIPQWRRTAI